MCVWDSIVGGGRGTGLLPLIFSLLSPPTEKFPEYFRDLGALMVSAGVVSYSPERVTTHAHTNPYNGDF